MSLTALKTLLLSSLLYSISSAFVQFNLHPKSDTNNNNNNLLLPTPQPSELDPAQWIPIATLAPLTTPLSTPTPSPSPSEEHHFNILPLLSPFLPDLPDLRKRQGAPAAPPAPQPTAINQISPITTYNVNSQIAPGSFAQVPVVYTQTFNPIPDQWPGPAAGTIGLGTIVGTVGQVRKSKREEVVQPTQVPVFESKTLEMEVRKTKSWSA